MSTYISGKDQAKMIRQALKEAYGKKVKFSVRKKSMNAIYVSWTDGPTQGEVNSIVQIFAGGYFDGMNDYQGGYRHEIDGEEVSFSCEYIFSQRSISEEFIVECSDAFKAMSGREQLKLYNDSSIVWWHRDRLDALELNSDEYNTTYGKMLAHQKGIEATPSPTAESVVLVGKY